MVYFPSLHQQRQAGFTPMVSDRPPVVEVGALSSGRAVTGDLFHSLVVHKGVGQLLLVFYSGLQAMLLILLVRTMGKPALTSCS